MSGYITNKTFQDCYTNLMIIYQDKSHLAKVTMLTQKFTFNPFNGSLDRYLESMIQKFSLGDR